MAGAGRCPIILVGAPHLPSGWSLQKRAVCPFPERGHRGVSGLASWIPSHFLPPRLPAQPSGAPASVRPAPCTPLMAGGHFRPRPHTVTRSHLSCLCTFPKRAPRAPALCPGRPESRAARKQVPALPASSPPWPVWPWLPLTSSLHESLAWLSLSTLTCSHLRTWSCRLPCSSLRLGQFSVHLASALFPDSVLSPEGLGSAWCSAPQKPPGVAARPCCRLVP